MLKCIVKQFSLVLIYLPHSIGFWCYCSHYNDVIMGTIASLITSLTIAYSIVYSDADQRKHQSSASLAFMRGSHRGPMNSSHKWPVTRKMFPFDDVIMTWFSTWYLNTVFLWQHTEHCSIMKLMPIVWEIGMTRKRNVDTGVVCVKFSMHQILRYIDLVTTLPSYRFDISSSEFNPIIYLTNFNWSIIFNAVMMSS